MNVTTSHVLAIGITRIDSNKGTLSICQCQYQVKIQYVNRFTNANEFVVGITRQIDILVLRNRAQFAQNARTRIKTTFAQNELNESDLHDIKQRNHLGVPARPDHSFRQGPIHSSRKRIFVEICFRHIIKIPIFTQI